MPDVVVTVPKRLWDEWIDEGDLPSEQWSGFDSYFWIGRRVPNISKGERVYIVAHGKLRGYAPLVSIFDEVVRHADETWSTWQPDEKCRVVGLVRRGGAVAVTIDEPIRGFQGFRYRWWDRADERPFENWREI